MKYPIGFPTQLQASIELVLLQNRKNFLKNSPKYPKPWNFHPTPSLAVQVRGAFAKLVKERVKASVSEIAPLLSDAVANGLWRVDVALRGSNDILWQVVHDAYSDAEHLPSSLFSSFFEELESEITASDQWTNLLAAIAGGPHCENRSADPQNAAVGEGESHTPSSTQVATVAPVAPPMRNADAHCLSSAAESEGLADLDGGTGPATWDTIEIIFIDARTVQIVRNGKISEPTTYVHLGFADGRTERGSSKPNKAWDTLQLLAQENGVICNPTPRISPAKEKSVKDVNAEKNAAGRAWGRDLSRLQKRIQEIRKALRTYFRIDADPILHKEAGRYEARFKTRWRRI